MIAKSLPPSQLQYRGLTVVALGGLRWKHWAMGLHRHMRCQQSWHRLGLPSAAALFLVLALALQAIAAGGAGPAAAATAPDQAAKFLKTLGEQAIVILRDADQPLAHREAKLRDLLRRGFDLQFIGRFTLGRYWRRVTEAQRNEYQSLFANYVLQSYSSRLGGYAGESFTVTTSRGAGKKDALVHTRIGRPSGPPLECDWRVRQRGGQLRIIDVMVEGVSMAVTQRSEFSSVIKSRGFDGLLSALRARTNKLSAVASK